MFAAREVQLEKAESGNPNKQSNSKKMTGRYVNDILEFLTNVEPCHWSLHHV
jgi:hypothetical protein